MGNNQMERARSLIEQASSALGYELSEGERVDLLLDNMPELRDSDEARKLVVSALTPEPAKCMAELFVRYFSEWQDEATKTRGFTDYLTGRNLIGSGYGQIAFIQFWDTRPVRLNEDGYFEVNKNVVCNYAVLDFEDGSIAIRRSHGDRGPEEFMVARPEVRNAS